MNDNTGAGRRFSGLKLTAAPLALMLLMAGSYAAYAAVTNTVTATGTGPSGPAGGVEATANEIVDVEDDAPTIAVVRNWSFVPGATGDVNGNNDVDAGDQIFYTYVVTNSGNVTLTDVNVNDVHDGTGAALTFLTPTSVTTDNFIANSGQQNDSTDVGSNNDGDWDFLGPNDVITFTSAPYTIVPGDLTDPDNLDGNMEGTVTASGGYDPGSAPITVSGTNTIDVPLQNAPSLDITKVADQTVNVTAGTLVTYTYTVTNDGPVPITNITLADTHNGNNGTPGFLTPVFQSFTAGTGSTNTGNTITLLVPGGVAVYTATYTVTQSDVDTLQ